MQSFSYPSARALMTQAKNNLSVSLIDTTKIFDYDLNREARLINEKILAATQTLTALDKSLFQQIVLKLQEIDDSVLKDAVMHVNAKGLLQLTDSFFMTTHLKSGLRFVPHFNMSDTKDKGIYFVECPYGLRLGDKNMNLLLILEKAKIPYPNRALWSSMEYENRRAFRLEFPEPIRA